MPGRSVRTGPAPARGGHGPGRPAWWSVQERRFAGERLHFGVRTFFDPFGSLAESYREVDWASTPLGDVTSWSEALLNAVDLMTHTRFPVTLLWGPEFVMVYNEAYVPLIADKHPKALGAPARDVFPEAWHQIGPMMQGVLGGEGATWVEDEYVPLHRRGFLEECYFTFSYSPVHGRDGLVEGVMDIATETTSQVISRRRLQLLTELNARLADAQEAGDVLRGALPLLRGAVRDFPAVDIRLHGLPTRRDAALPSSPPSATDGGVETVEKHGDLRVARLPLSSSESPAPSHLVVALSPQLAPDEEYLGFLRLVASSLRQALDRMQAMTAERRAAEAQRSMSEAFQRSLLPLPMASGRPQVAVRYQPAAELAQVGGDWYDWFELPDGSLTVVVGDVAGHDQQAAAAMAQVRNLARGVAYTLHPAAPGRVLHGLDQAMRGSARDIVATGVLAQVEEGDRPGLSLTWSNAGHPPPVLIEVDGSTRFLDTAPDLLLGLDDDVPRADHRIQLEPGASVVFYTDGLIERRGTPISEGLEWLARALRGKQGLQVEELCDFLLGEVVAVEDDVALLILRA